MNINVTKQGDGLVAPKTAYYVATYKKYVEADIPDNITNKELVPIQDEKNLSEELKNQIGFLVSFNLENKDILLKDELGNYYNQQKLINE